MERFWSLLVHTWYAYAPVASLQKLVVQRTPCFRKVLSA